MTNASTDKGDRQEMMKSMMDQCCADMGTDEKKEMFATMMGKMTEGLDMKEMMPKMMKGMMSGDGPGGMSGMMGKMMPGDQQEKSPMPEMMLGTMMPHCIGMMLPAISPDKRSEIAASILSEIVDKGSAGMSDEQERAFRKALEEALSPSV